MRVILLSIALMTLNQGPVPLDPPGRTVCCHGCGSKYCKKSTCGTKCQASPCHGCWKKSCQPKS
jgi:hypothetical protein